MASDLDIVLQALWQKSPATFLHQAGVGPVTILNIGHRSQPLIKERELDGALILRDQDGHDWVSHVEFESSPSKAELPFRVFQYASLLHIAHRLPVRSFVFLVNENAIIDDFYMVQSGGKTLRYEFTIIRIFAQAASLLAADPLLAPLTPLARDVQENDLQKAWETLKSHAPEDKLADLSAVLYILCRSKNMHVSSSLQQELRRIARTSPGFADLYQDLLAEGKAEGKAEGETQGEARALQQSILRYLKHRFPKASWDSSLLETLPLAVMIPLQEQIWDVPEAKAARALIQKALKTTR